MSVGILYDQTKRKGCFISDDEAFGPVFDAYSWDCLDKFWGWLGKSPREFTSGELLAKWDQWLTVEIIRDEAVQGFFCQHCGLVVDADVHHGFGKSRLVAESGLCMRHTETTWECPKCGWEDWDEVKLCERCKGKIEEGSEVDHLQCYEVEP